MANVDFSYNGTEISIQCTKEDTMKDICNKFATKVDKNINSLLFIYNGNKINYDLTYKKQANSIDNNRNKMNILVYQNENDGLKCKKCGEKIDIGMMDNLIKYNNEQKETLIEMKNQIDNIINLNDINDIKRKIKFIKSVINDLINNNVNYLKDIQNKINKSDSIISKNNNHNLEINFSFKFDSNEEKILKTFIFKSLDQYSDYKDIASNIFKNCREWKKGGWAVVVGEKDKFIIHSSFHKSLSGIIGLYKIAIDYNI